MSYSFRRLTAIGAAVIACVTAARSADAQRLVYSGSLQASTGEYIFGERTTSFYLLTGLRLIGARSQFTISAPLVLQNSSAISWIAGVPVPTGGPDHAIVRQRRQGGGQGPGGRRAASAGASRDTADIVEVTPPGPMELHVGDPRAGASLDLVQGTGLLRAITLDGFAKAPVATLESGVGTGEWDFGAGLSLSLGGGATFVFIDATWWRVGDLPDLVLEDPLFYGLSIGHAFGGYRWSILGSVSGSTPIIEGVDPPVSVAAAISRTLRSGSSLSFGVGTGLSEAGSDFSVSLAWSLPLHR